jgi:hypothetical protein
MPACNHKPTIWKDVLQTISYGLTTRTLSSVGRRQHSDAAQKRGAKLNAA